MSRARRFAAARPLVSRRLAFALPLACGFAGAFALDAFAEAPLDGGTAITVQVADGGDTTVEVKRGSLQVRAGGEETHVGAGQGAHVRRGGKAKKISLLPAPSTVKPTDGEHLNHVTVQLAWHKVDGARKYKLAVAADPGFANPVYEASAEGADTISVKLDAGTFYWRVTAVDGEGLEGQPTRARRFVVDTTPPKLKAGKPKWR